MACEAWRERLIESLYGEIDPTEAGTLERHLESCASCRTEIQGLGETRNLLRQAAGELPAAPRVLVLTPRPFARPRLAFAAGFSLAALLLAAGATAGWSFATRTAATAAPTVSPGRFVTDADLERSLASLRRENSPVAVTSAEPRPEPLTREEMTRALARLERRFEGRREDDFQYLVRRLAASEYRSDAKIGQTREALRYVALASNPAITAH